jgi:antitoxin HicB
MPNKNLDYYMSLRYRIELTPEEDGSWGATHPDLLGCAGAGATIPEALAMLEDARRGWFESRLAGDHPIPEPQTATHAA